MLGHQLVHSSGGGAFEVEPGDFPSPAEVLINSLPSLKYCQGNMRRNAVYDHLTEVIRFLTSAAGGDTCYVGNVNYIYLDSAAIIAFLHLELVTRIL
jgi:hypothetical protein